jgi:hypothetical protein
MRALAIAALVALGPAGAALALPALPLEAPAGIVQVQLQCTPASCIDPRTGVYTESTCDYRGCRPSSGPVGRLGGAQRGYGGGHGGGYDDDPPPRRRRDWDDGGRGYDRGGYGGGYGGGGRFDCNANRCIETGTGRVWESTCDRRGCRPLRPARGY